MGRVHRVCGVGIPRARLVFCSLRAALASSYLLLLPRCCSPSCRALNLHVALKASRSLLTSFCVSIIT